MNNLTGSFIIGYDFEDTETGVLFFVRTRASEGRATIINAFSGKDARALLDILTTKQEEKNGNT